MEREDVSDGAKRNVEEGFLHQMFWKILSCITDFPVVKGPRALTMQVEQMEGKRDTMKCRVEASPNLLTVTEVVLHGSMPFFRRLSSSSRQLIALELYLSLMHIANMWNNTWNILFSHSSLSRKDFEKEKQGIQEVHRHEVCSSNQVHIK